MRKYTYSLLLLLIMVMALTLVMAACRGIETARAPAAQIPQPDPTATPTRLKLPDPPTPTSVVSELVSTQPYTHTTQRFRIEYPANWHTAEQADGVIFIEPGDQAGYSVFFSDVGEPYSAEQLNQFLVTFVAQNFAQEGSEFEAVGQKTRPDGSIEAQFKTMDPRLGQTFNEIRVLQVETLVFILLISSTEEQWEISQDRLQNLADTLTVLDTSPAAEVELTDEPPVWLIIGPLSNQFAFFYPSDWEIAAQEENSITVKMPETEIIFEANTFAWPGAGSRPDAAAKAAEAFITNLEKKYDNVETLPATEFPLHTMTGATIDFLYTTPSDEEMAGSIITAGSKGQMYRIVFTAPAKYYQAALEWFNPMYKSFTTLSPEELVVEPETQ